MLKISAVVLTLLTACPALAAPCGDSARGFEDWKPVMAAEAEAQGVGKKGRAALLGASYSKATIAADRNQKSFKYSLSKFMELRGATTIVKQGRARKAKNPAFYASLEKQYGVSSGVILAIHGMETGFGGFMGDTNVVSAIATLAWDCRRSDFFTGHLIGALKLVDAGAISAQTVGDGVLDLTDTTDALATTANYLRAKGWKPGKGFQEGEPNFAVIKEWNAAKVYQQAIAIMGAKIDE